MGLIKKKKDEDDTKSIESTSPDKEGKFKRLLKKKNRESAELSSTPSLSPDQPDEKKKHWYSVNRRKKDGTGNSMESLRKSQEVLEEQPPIPEDPLPKSSSRDRVNNNDPSPRSRSNSDRSARRRRPSTPREQPKEDFEKSLMRKESPNSSRERVNRIKTRDEFSRKSSTDSIENAKPQRTITPRKRSRSGPDEPRSRSNSNTRERRKESPPPTPPTAAIIYKSSNRDNRTIDRSERDIKSPQTPTREIPKDLLTSRELSKDSPPLKEPSREPTRHKSTKSNKSHKSNKSLEMPPPTPVKRVKSQHSEDEFILDQDATNHLLNATNKTNTKLTKDPNWPVEAQQLFDYFSKSFPYVFEEDFSPVVLALSIMLEKGPILDLNSLSHLILKAERAFELLVSDRYDQFQSSLETYTDLISNVSLSMACSKTAYNHGLEINGFLNQRNEDLLTLYNKSLLVNDKFNNMNIQLQIQTDLDAIPTLLANNKYSEAATSLSKLLKHHSSNPNIQTSLNYTTSLLINETTNLLFMKHIKTQSLLHHIEDSFLHTDPIILDLLLNQHLSQLVSAICLLNKQTALNELIFKLFPSELNELTSNIPNVSINNGLDINTQQLELLNNHVITLYAKLVGILTITRVISEHINDTHIVPKLVLLINTQLSRIFTQMLIHNEEGLFKLMGVVTTNLSLFPSTTSTSTPLYDPYVNKSTISTTNCNIFNILSLYPLTTKYAYYSKDTSLLEWLQESVVVHYIPNVQLLVEIPINRDLHLALDLIHKIQILLQIMHCDELVQLINTLIVKSHDNIKKWINGIFNATNGTAMITDFTLLNSVYHMTRDISWFINEIEMEATGGVFVDNLQSEAFLDKQQQIQQHQNNNYDTMMLMTLSDHIVTSLKTELHVHINYYMELIFRQGTYEYDQIVS